MSDAQVSESRDRTLHDMPGNDKPATGGRAGGLAGAKASFLSALGEEARYGHGFLWIPVGLATGAAVWFDLARDPPLVWIGLSFAVFAILFLFSASYPIRRFVSLVVCAVLAGMMASALETWRHSTTLLDSGVTTHVIGTVLSRDVDERGRWRYTIAIEETRDPQIKRPPERARILARGKHQTINIGQRISGLARLQPPSGPALPTTFDFAFNAYFNGLGAFGFFLGSPAPEPSIGEGATAGRHWPDMALWLAQLRETIALRIRKALPGEAGAFASALTVADRRAMSEETVEALRASGLAHVLAISGLHMALVAGTVFMAVRFGLGLFPGFAQGFAVKKLAAVLALLVATAYLLISGGSVSTQRAWLMLAIMLCAVLIDRPALTLRNVALAAICIILITPSAVVGPGFQMSFAATAALVAAYGWWRQVRTSRVKEEQGVGQGFVGIVLVFFLGLAVTSLVAGLATAPFAIYHFHRIAAYGLLANLAAMPVMTLVVMPAGLVSVILMPFGLEYWPLQVMGGGLHAVISIAETVEELGGMIVTGRMATGVFLGLTGGLLILVLARSWLRYLGLPVIAVALGAQLVMPTKGIADLLISEDGRTVALTGPGSLASNRPRPSAFLFKQWQRALRIPNHRAPGRLAADQWEFSGSDDSGQPIFLCRRRDLCVTTSGSGLAIAVVGDLSLLGAACDRADIVVTDRPIRMTACRSGALLVTGRMLRQTGALEIFHDEGGGLKMATAIGTNRRPWSVHRFYDWRSRSFQFEQPQWAVDGSDPR